MGKIGNRKYVYMLCAIAFVFIIVAIGKNQLFPEEPTKSTDTLADSGKDTSKDSSKDASKDSSKDASKDSSKDTSKDSTKDPSKDSSKNSNVDWYTDYTNASYTEDGIFYFEDNYLRYSDVETGLDVLVCDKIDCKHNKESCSAAFDASFLSGVKIEGDKLNFLTDYQADKMGTLFYYESDINGENRKKLATIDNVQYISGIQYYKQYIIATYLNTFDENLNNLDGVKAGILILDRDTNSSKIIFEKQNSNASIVSFGVNDDVIYFTYGYNELTPEEVQSHADDFEYIQKHWRSGLYSVSIQDGSESELVEAAEEVGSLPIYENIVFYTKDESTYSYDVTTKETTMIHKENLIKTPSFMEGKVVFYNYDNKTGENIYYVYHPETNKMEEIGRIKGYIPISIMNDITYVYYYDDSGNGSRGYIKTEDFLNGNFTDFHKL